MNKYPKLEHLTNSVNGSHLNVGEMPSVDTSFKVQNRYKLLLKMSIVFTLY